MYTEETTGKLKAELLDLYDIDGKPYMVTNIICNFETGNTVLCLFGLLFEDVKLVKEDEFFNHWTTTVPGRDAPYKDDPDYDYDSDREAAIGHYLWFLDKLSAKTLLDTDKALDEIRRKRMCLD